MESYQQCLMMITVMGTQHSVWGMECVEMTSWALAVQQDDLFMTHIVRHLMLNMDSVFTLKVRDDLYA